MIFSTCKACRFRPDILLSPDIEIAFGTKHCCEKYCFSKNGLLRQFKIYANMRTMLKASPKDSSN